VRDHHERYHNVHAVLLGYRKGGREFAKMLQEMGKRFMIIDYDPEVVDELDRAGYEYLYGDVTDETLLQEVGIEDAKIIITTISDAKTTEFILAKMQAVNPAAIVICTAETMSAAAEFYELGASYVIVPYSIGSERLGSFLDEHGLNRAEFKHYRRKHIEYIESYSKGEVAADPGGSEKASL
jgi:voltage-gated potassium channel